MILIKRVLIATDFSAVSESALTYGRAVARQFGATLHVLHVVDNVATRFAYGDAVTASFGAGDLQGELERGARADLDAFVTEDDRRELNAKAVVIVSNNAAKTICDYATDSAIDLIIMGATGRGAIDRMLMGSVADKVIRRAPCPVLTVRSLEREFVVPDALQRVEHAGV